MPVAVGVDVAKNFHWAEIKVADTGQVLTSRRVDNDPAAIADLIEERSPRPRPSTVRPRGLDVLGGIAGLAQAMLLEAGLRCVHVPGLAVNRARRATTGGERKSDPKDAKVIADQVRMRDDLRPVEQSRGVDAELRLLVARRRDLVADQTRRAGRMRDLLTSMHPGLERVADVTSKTGLWLLTRYVTPGEVRRAGRTRLVVYLHRAGRVKTSTVEALAEAALAAARAQRVAVPGEATAADLVRELATEALAERDKLARVDQQIHAVLDRHPNAALVSSLPGMGAILTAEFLAEAGGGIDRFPTPDQLASAAGLAPVLKQSGKMRYLQGATSGNRALKRTLYQAAFCAIQHDPDSRAFYARKRAEGKRHHQALVALARRRVNVLHALLRTRQPYRARSAKAA